MPEPVFNTVSDLLHPDKRLSAAADKQNLRSIPVRTPACCGCLRPPAVMEPRRQCPFDQFQQRLLGRLRRKHRG